MFRRGRGRWWWIIPDVLARPRLGCGQAAVRCQLELRHEVHGLELRLRVAVRQLRVLPRVRWRAVLR